SNSGPGSFAREDGRIVARRGGGGLVTAMTAALHRGGGLWIASAMSEEDREMASHGAVDISGEGPATRVRYLPFDHQTYEGYYNGISNRVLWFVHHYLWDIPRSPRFDHDMRRNWAAYRRVNRTFADALVEEAHRMGDPVHLVQDYHLSL